ncbi:MAG: hypothetical protein WDO16_11435 [Bacteroidota bacterium]
MSSGERRIVSSFDERPFIDTVYTRLQYIIDFTGKELKVDSLIITSSAEEFQRYNGLRINYSDNRVTANEIWIKPHALLFEKGIRQQTIDCFDVNGNKAFFKTEGDISFDIFAASFYLLSRYEEYLPHTKDMYGRYAFENSLAYKENFLSLPLINLWLKELNDIIQKRFPDPHSPLTTPNSALTFLPTYDIDIAWSYKHKGWWRNAGGLLRSFISGQWSLAKERVNVLRGKERDPFDAFGWMNKIHEQYKLKPYYFFLVPKREAGMIKIFHLPVRLCRS